MISKAEAEADDAILESMDIDGDFNAWTSFRESIHDSGNNTNPDTGNDEAAEETRKEQVLLSRDEIFSHFYKPTEEELKQITKVAISLGFKGNVFGPYKASGEKEVPACLLMNIDVKDHELAKSILLKKGPTLCNNEERELILVTHGVILKKVAVQKGLFQNNKLFDRAFKLVDVAHVIDCNLSSQNTEGDGEEKGEYSLSSFSLVFSDETKWEFKCANEHEKNRWIFALQKSVLPALIRSRPVSTRPKGWQHEVFQTSIWSAGVRGDINMLKRALFLTPQIINEVDEYGFATLHYSVMNNHAECVRFLFQQDDLDYTMQTSSGSSIMELAQDSDDDDEIKTILHDHGVKDITSTEKKKKEDELFEGATKKDVPQSQESERSHKHLIGNLSKKANTVTGAMSEAMAGLIQRGEKLKLMENKASQMKEEAEEYKDLASQLKAQQKKKANSLFPW